MNLRFSTQTHSKLRALITTFAIAFACLSASVWAIDQDTKTKKLKNEKSQAKPQVMFETSSGNIVIELFPKEAPITVANFLQYVDDGFFNGTIFHRVVPNFVVQGGGFTFDVPRKQTRDPIKNESDNKLKNVRGTLSMARTGEIDSATSQFFINTNDNAALDFSSGRHGYAVFAKVIEGFDNVLKIEREPRGLYRAHPEAPNYPIIIEKAYRLGGADQKIKKEGTKP